MSIPSQPVAIKCSQCSADLAPGDEPYVICQYCGTSLLWQVNNAGATQEGVHVGRGIRMQSFSYTDYEVTGLVMFQMLVPVGWQMQGGCRWNLDNPSMPATLHIQFFNPGGVEAFEIMPSMNFIWYSNLMVRMWTPEGSRYFGAEVRPPIGVQQALREYVLPRYRGSAPGLKILKEEQLPDLPVLVRSMALTQGCAVEGASIRIRYHFPEGPAVDEEIVGTVEAASAGSPGMFGVGEVTSWNINYLYGLRTQVDRLDYFRDLFSVMIRSFQPNPQWYVAYNSLTQSLAQQQIQQIQNLGQISQIISRTSNEMQDQLMQSYQERQDVHDRLGTQWSRVNRGVDGYVDQVSSNLVELPGGYSQAWSNGLGEYIVSDDLNFDPNIGSNQNWNLMQRDE